MENMAKACLCRLYYGYLRLFEKTAWLEVEIPDTWTKDMPDRGAVIGFWHEDSLLMSLLLKKLSEGRDIAVIMTSDERGDCIENIIKRYNGRAARVPDGCRSRDLLRNPTGEAGRPGRTLATVMDGPLESRRVPKTLGFYLAEKRKKNFVEVRTGYSGAVCLGRQWDHYRIPPPFINIKVSLKDCGIIGDRNTVFPG